MTLQGRLLIALAWLPAATVANAAMAAGAGFQHDLFARPPVEMLKAAAPEPVKTVTPPPAPPEWKPELRAIIAGQGVTLVNVEGRIVQMGQDIDGYRLVEVKDRQALFVKNKVRYALDLVAVKGAGAPDSPAAAAPVAAPPAPAAPAGALPPPPSVPAATPLSAAAPMSPAQPVGMGMVKASDVLSKPSPTAPGARGGIDQSPAERRGG